MVATSPSVTLSILCPHTINCEDVLCHSAYYARFQSCRRVLWTLKSTGVHDYSEIEQLNFLLFNLPAVIFTCREVIPQNYSRIVSNACVLGMNMYGNLPHIM